MIVPPSPLPLLPHSKNPLKMHTTSEKCEQRILFLSMSVEPFLWIGKTTNIFKFHHIYLLAFLCKNNTANRVLSSCILICRCTMLLSHFYCVEILILFIGIFWVAVVVCAFLAQNQTVQHLHYIFSKHNCGLIFQFCCCFCRHRHRHRHSFSFNLRLLSFELL